MQGQQQYPSVNLRLAEHRKFRDENSDFERLFVVIETEMLEICKQGCVSSFRKFLLDVFNDGVLQSVYVVVGEGYVDLVGWYGDFWDA